ncbi:MAG TPA: tetratricopeptide repeat protein [Pyrinomonadaceae bacterium]|nr:tetratricopeptide repeat protein [Pyrinomonadaceae bacterium]
MNKRNRFSAIALVAALVLAPFTPAFTLNVNARAAALQQDDVPSDAEQTMFTKGQNLYNQGRYDQAVTVLQDFLKTYPRSIITDLTLLWLGRSYMQLGRIKEAEQVGQRLHTIKDTPFADIYDSELQTARAERGSAPSSAVAAATPTPTPRKIPNATPTPTPAIVTKRQVTTPPTATPTPTPVARKVESIRGGQTRQTPPMTLNNNKAAATQANNASSTQANANKAQSNTATQIARNVLPPTRRGIRSGRRVTPPQTTPSNSIASQNANTSTAVKQPVTNNANRVTQPQVAINNTPTRTTTKPIAPTVRPTPQPSPAASNTNTSPLISTTPSRPAEVAVNNPPATINPPSETPLPQAGGLSVTVRQVPNLVLSLARTSEFAQPGQTIQLPLTVRNTGNKEDQFLIETDLPAEYQPTFSAAQSGAGTELPVYLTPQLARDSSIDVTLNIRVPETATDGQQMRFTVRAASQADYQKMKVADGMLNVIAASLTAATNVSNNSVMPGETFTQTITVKNAGSSPARSTRADFVFNPNFELVSANPAPLTYDRSSRVAIWNMGDLGSRSSHDISVTLRVVPDALASTNPLGRGAVHTQSLTLGSNFDSPVVTVGKVPKARIEAVSTGLTTTPGDTTYIPFVVRNPGNAADSYELRVTAPGAPNATIYADTNGDGQHQESEPVITQTSQIDPRGGQFPLLLRVQIPASTPDKQQFSYNVVARSISSGREASEANTVLTVVTPRVRVRTEGMTDTVAPGDTFFYRLVLVNEGSGLAKNLVVNETLPPALEFVSSDPNLSAQDASGGQQFRWRVAELAPGDTAVLRVTVRLRPNQSADQTLTTRHSLSYQDPNGNNYSGQ